MEGDDAWNLEEAQKATVVVLPFTMTLNGWHRGEQLVHKKLGHEKDYTIMTLYRSIGGDLPGDHATFHSTRLPFIPAATLDAEGRPWGSILAGREGKPGFVRNTRYSVLSVDAKVWPGEPLIENAKVYEEDGSMLVAGIGIEFPTRRRNKFAGEVKKLERDGDLFHLDLFVDEAIGNCPKYINARDLVPHPGTSPKVIHNELHLDPSERLPADVIAFIQENDTVFIGTTYQAHEDEAARYPSHLGMNQRGGRKGFIRVMPSDGRTIVLPDFSGNRFMTSLGNIEATPLASLTFVSFTTGDILYLTGTAANHFNHDAQQIMPLQNGLTTVYVTGYIYVADALPVRQKPNTVAQPSPYSPPIRLLAEETPQSTHFQDANAVTATLTRIALHSATIATFTWETSSPLPIVPGQAAIMDFSPLLGTRKYQHMAPMKPTSVNDDYIRTWTVSAHSSSSYSLTMRLKPGGAVTGALFSIAHKLAQVKPELLGDSRPLALSVGVVGITGEFVLPAPQEADTLGDGRGIRVPHEQPEPVTRLLWVAGGIGVTPFLAMLRGLRSSAYDIRLVLSTREPEVLVPLLEDALRELKQKPRLVIDLFSTKASVDLKAEGAELRKHVGRVTKGVFEDGGDHPGTREVYICGPSPFEVSLMAALEELGVEKNKIKREGFEY
ncbi:hypothetical protein DXG03_009716 [Asterophora parasitica]|uniref:Oxidoreductase FAD/NAD(P)-binding domain-containing protein n=1 Tax=Asterophora parasitica TaxID=117018 RepID=A0A9P7KDC3_9AGAR|nr:hypothetical protein DXG03_009716 [Asterophora parasitica]